MYLVTGKIIKQNLEDSFYTIADPITSPEIRTHWAINYKECGKCIAITVNLSDNQLELETVQIWQDQASYEEYKNDPVLIAGLFEPRELYWQEHGINKTIISEEIV